MRETGEHPAARAAARSPSQERPAPGAPTPIGRGRRRRSAVTIQPNPDWPVLTSYEGRRLDRVALPLGGIGTGTVALGGRGDLRDWEIVNRPAKGFSPDHACFALRAQPTAGPAAVRALEGVLRPSYE